MNNLESIVPPLELCRMIPAGEFEDSVLMWRERIGNISRDERVKIREPEDISYKVESATVNYFPAPTLEEVLDAIGKVDNWDTATITRPIGVNARIVDTALKRWFEVKEIQCE